MGERGEGGAVPYRARSRVRKRPTSQATTSFLPTTGREIYPSAESPKELAYTVGIDADDGFVVKIDTVGLDDGGSLCAGRTWRCAAPSTTRPPSWPILPAAEGLEKSLAELVAWSVEAIRDFKLRYDEVVAKLNLGKTLSDEDLLKHFDGKPAFKTFRASWSPQDKALFCRLAQSGPRSRPGLVAHGQGHPGALRPQEPRQ